MQSKLIVFQHGSVACGNRVVKRLWMTEACTLVSLLIVVWCLHAFGPHTTAMARGSLTAEPWVRAVCWKGALSRGAALSMCAFHGWVHKAHIPPACLLVFVRLCVCTHIGKKWRGEDYNNKLGSSVTLNSPIFREESKHNWLLPRICTYYKCTQVSQTNKDIKSQSLM